MSGDLSQVQLQMIINELVHNLKKISVSQSANIYAETVDQMTNQLTSLAPNGFNKNYAVVMTLIDNLHTAVPIFDTILSLNDTKDVRFRPTSAFLKYLASSFDGVCLFEVFTRLNETERLKVIFKNYLALLKESYFTDDTAYDELAACLIPVVALSSLLIPLDEKDIPVNLLGCLLVFSKRHCFSNDRERLMRCILGLIKVFSKKPTLAPLVLQSGWAKACVEWLKSDDGQTAQKRPSYGIDYHILLIIQKLARNSCGVKILNELNCLKALEESIERMRRDHPASDFECLCFLQSMIYALLMEADDIKQISLADDSSMCSILKQIVLHTIEASRTEFFSYKCFHLSEILSVLCKLFVNDDMLVKCLDNSNQLFECLSQLITHFCALKLDPNRPSQPTDDEMLLTLANILWSISFHQKYQDKFQSNTMLMHTLSNLAASSSVYATIKNRSIPRDLCSLKKAAEGIMWNLKSSTETTVNTELSKRSSEKTEKSPMAMISYSHSDATFCRELVERLSTRVPVWVDYKQAQDTIAHSDDLWEEIARAMEMATVIILIVSKEYYDSKSCRQELSYATDTLKKRILPIYAPYQQYRASGWLGIRIAGQKYVHFGRKLFSDAIDELASMIVNEQKPSTPLITSSEGSTIEKSVDIEIKPYVTEKIVSDQENKLSSLKTWTKTDIDQWFTKNQIHPNLAILYADRFQTGTSLIVYARHLKYFYRNEYIRIYTKYYEVFDGKRLDTFDFISLADAFYRFRLEYDPLANVEDKFSDHPALHKLKELEDGMTWF